MKQIFNKITIVTAILALSATSVHGENVADIKSPGGTLSLLIENDGGTVAYTLSRGSNTVVEKSRVGLVTTAADFSSGVTIKSVDTKEINEQFTLVNASQSTLRDVCREVTVNIEKNSQSGAVIFRLYDEGVAWRYTLNGSGSVTVTGDAGRVSLPRAEEYLNLPLRQGTRASFTPASSDLLECMGTAALPLVARNGDLYTVICETAPVKDFCGSRLKVPEKDTYEFSTIENVTATLPLATPWRVILNGNMGAVASTQITECLGDASTISSTSWIKPGRAVNAYSGQDHTASYLDGNKVNAYIDWASAQGWEYITLDKWWNLTLSQLKQVVNYANARNVGVIVWKSRASLPTAEAAMRAELVNIKQAGAKGIKVEFWENETRAIINQRNMLLSIAAEQQLMVLLSNTVNTAGLSRTWPHLMGIETGITNSSAVFAPDMVGAEHNINAALFHGLTGPVDYYPVDFAEYNGKLLQSTTHAHQLALAVAFRSGIQHIADAPDNLKYSITKNVLKSIPAKWDGTQWLEAIHGEEAIVVRRSGNDYYLAGLATAGGTRHISLSFLPEGMTLNAYIYSDGNCPTEINFDYKKGLTASATLPIYVAANGGFLVRFTDDDGSAKPFYTRYEAEWPSNGIPFGVSVVADSDGLCSEGAYVSGAGAGRPLTINNVKVPSPGQYALNVYYMSSETVSGSVRLNGQLSSIRGLNFINTGGATGRALGCLTVTMQFDKTDGNTLEISSSATLPNIDRISITDNESTSFTAGVESIGAESEDFCRAYADGGNVVIDSTKAASYAIYNTQGICLAKGEIAAGVNTVFIDATGVVIVNLNTEDNTQTEKIIL